MDNQNYTVPFIRVSTTPTEHQLWVGAVLVRSWPLSGPNRVEALNLNADLCDALAEHLRRAISF